MAYLFPEMLVPLAKHAKIRVPRNVENYDPDRYPHWHVFQSVQLGTSLPWPEAGWQNAQVVADIPDHKIRTIKLPELERRGFRYGRSHG